MNRVVSTLRSPRGLSTRRAARLLALGLALTLLLLASRAQLSGWLEPVSGEIPEWTSALLGLSADASDTWMLEVDPQVLRAAELLVPADAQTASEDRWWFPAEVNTNGRSYSVDAQLVSRRDQDEGIRVRFKKRARPDGIENIEFIVASAERHGRAWLASETAREVGLIAAPGGFARLAINGGEAQLVFWREAASAPMLQRLGYPESEIFRSTRTARRGPSSAQLPSPYVASLNKTPARPHRAALEQLVALVHSDTAQSPADFEKSLSRIVNIDKLLTWDALARLLGAQDTVGLASDWYFDPVTGLLEPVYSTVDLDSLGAGEPRQRASEAGAAARALLTSPRRLAERDALLREWAGATQSLLLADADNRLGAMASRLAGSSSWYARARDLFQLAELRRGTREQLRSSNATLRHELESRRLTLTRSPAKTEDSALSASDVDAAQTWVAESGLRFDIDGEWLRLPAGEHHIAQTLVIPDSHRLLIDPGAHLVMAPNASIFSFRGVRAIGTRRAPISIRALDTARPWGAIGIARAPETSEFAYITIAGGSDAKFAGIKFTGQLSVNGSHVVVRDADILHSSGDDSMSVKRGVFQVTRSRFLDNQSDGFDAEWSKGSIEQSLFANNGDDGLDLGTSEVRVHRTWFRSMRDKAVSAGEKSIVNMTDSHLVDSQIAIASKEDSRVEIRGTEFRRNEIGISLYRDNSIYGSGYGTVSGGLFSENLRDFAVEAGSALTLNGVERQATDDAGIVVGLHSSSVPSFSTLPSIQ